MARAFCNLSQGRNPINAIAQGIALFTAIAVISPALLHLHVLITLGFYSLSPCLQLKASRPHCYA